MQSVQDSNLDSFAYKKRDANSAAREGFLNCTPVKYKTQVEVGRARVLAIGVADALAFLKCNAVFRSVGRKSVMKRHKSKGVQDQLRTGLCLECSTAQWKTRG